MKPTFVISLICLFQIIDATDAGLVIPGITSVDYYDYRDDYYEENITVKPPNLNTGIEENVVEVSKDVLKKIDSVGDLKELQRLLGIEVNLKVFTHNLGSIFHEEDLETRSRKSGRYIDNPRQAHCEPEMHSVDLGLKNTADVTYYPTCVRVKQCGGCCPDKETISCQPIASDKVVVKVYELFPNKIENTISGDSRSSSRSRRRGNKIKLQVNTINVTVEEHKECACLCKLRESNCNLVVHFYNDKDCACVCKNKDEEEKCFSKSTHLWRQDTCECLCRHEIACSSSEIFDHSSCMCKSTSLGLSLNNVLLRKRHPWDSILRRRPVSVPVTD